MMGQIQNRPSDCKREKEETGDRPQPNPKPSKTNSSGSEALGITFLGPVPLLPGPGWQRHPVALGGGPAL